jgi:head-tail adaptor
MKDSCILNPGELRHGVVIQAAGPTRDDAGQLGATRDDAGQPISAWDTVLTTRCKIENTGSLAFKMSFSDNTRASDSTDLITIRWPGAAVVVEPDQRVLACGCVFTIQAVDNVLHRNRVVRLACLEIDGDSN